MILRNAVCSGETTWKGWTVKKKKPSLYKPGQPQRFPGDWGSQIWRQTAHEGCTFLIPTHRPPLPPGNIHGTHFCQRLSQPQDHSAAGRIKSMKNSNDTIGNRNRDLPACSVVSQPTAPPRALRIEAHGLTRRGFYHRTRNGTRIASYDKRWSKQLWLWNWSKWLCPDWTINNKDRKNPSKLRIASVSLSNVTSFVMLERMWKGYSTDGVTSKRTSYVCT